MLSSRWFRLGFALALLLTCFAGVNTPTTYAGSCFGTLCGQVTNYSTRASIVACSWEPGNPCISVFNGENSQARGIQDTDYMYTDRPMKMSNTGYHRPLENIWIDNWTFAKCYDNYVENVWVGTAATGYSYTGWAILCNGNAKT